MKAEYGVAISQYGERFYFGKYCRKDLSRQVPGEVRKMFADCGPKVVQVGYVIGKLWLTVYTDASEVQ